MRRLDRLELIVHEIKAAGYSVTRHGTALGISRPDFHRAITVSIGKLNAADVIARLESYRAALWKAQGGGA
jgi:hypothetical protein